MIGDNHELNLAEQYIHETGINVFLTGKAGTGKTTFLRNLQKSCSKRMVVAAPTGVAAINAGGVTLHSFFQLPFGPFIPGNEYEQGRSQFRFSKQKQNIIRNLDLLVIDEISMVRADLLDSVDHVLRKIRRRSEPFGGVQLLMIGDLHQLPPVVKANDWPSLKRHYSSPFFFSSLALAQTEMCKIELKTIYRQADQTFIDILNEVRDSRITAETFSYLNGRVEEDYAPDEGVITLCTHNSRADEINDRKISSLPTKLYSFDAEVDGDFPDHIYPASDVLELKKGAQVMFIRNDSSEEKRFFNGKIGVITKISNDSIEVNCTDDNSTIEVAPVSWDNIEYKLNESTLEIEEKKVGSFKQYPLRYAWAITIHKSQGLTFDHAVIDAQAAFAHGQVYVALSRCRTLEGMVLASPLSKNGLQVERAVLQFNRLEESWCHIASEESLYKAKISFQQTLMLECFDFKKLRGSLGRTVSLILGNQTTIQVLGVKDIVQVQREAEETIFSVSENFQRQLFGLFSKDSLPMDDPAIVERLDKAATYFSEKISDVLTVHLEKLELETDNKEIRKRIKKSLQWLQENFRIKRYVVDSCLDGFSASKYFKAISKAVLEKPKVKTKKNQITYSEVDIAHPDLFHALREWRSDKASEENIAYFQVMHQKTLVQIAVNLPDSVGALLKIKGIGPKLCEKYGDELVDMIVKYRKDNGLKEVKLPDDVV